jgi:ABC-2 type transport system ATP-binding protein
MHAIATQALTKVYKSLAKAKKPSLDHLDLQVAREECFGFLGRNGAGKTTTIKLLCSLIHPTSGTALIFGESVQARATRRLIGYLPEQPYFYEYLTPRETVDFYGRVRGLSQAERTREWDRLSELLDLKDIAAQRIKGFSKGMRQRVGFAIALLGNPELLILDEPMSGLDPVGRRTIRELMLRLKAEKKTLFFSSHVLADVEQVCDRVGMLVGGRLIQQGRIADLIGGTNPAVEVSIAQLDDTAAARIAGAQSLRRTAEGLNTILFPDLAAANAALAAIQAAGGLVVEFSPVRESLEAYFMREQAAHAGAHSAREIA